MISISKDVSPKTLELGQPCDPYKIKTGKVSGKIEEQRREAISKFSKEVQTSFSDEEVRRFLSINLETAVLLNLGLVKAQGETKLGLYGKEKKNSENSKSYKKMIYISHQKSIKPDTQGINAGKFPYYVSAIDYGCEVIHQDTRTNNNIETAQNAEATGEASARGPSVFGNAGGKVTVTRNTDDTSNTTTALSSATVSQIIPKEILNDIDEIADFDRLCAEIRKAIKHKDEDIFIPIQYILEKNPAAEDREEVFAKMVDVNKTLNCIKEHDYPDGQMKIKEDKLASLQKVFKKCFKDSDYDDFNNKYNDILGEEEYDFHSWFEHNKEKNLPKFSALKKDIPHITEREYEEFSKSGLNIDQIKENCIYNKEKCDMYMLSSKRKQMPENLSIHREGDFEEFFAKMPNAKTLQFSEDAHLVVNFLKQDDVNEGEKLKGDIIVITNFNGNIKDFIRTKKINRKSIMAIPGDSTDMSNKEWDTMHGHFFYLLIRKNRQVNPFYKMCFSETDQTEVHVYSY